MTAKILSFSYGGIDFLFAIDESETTISQTVQKTGVWEPYQLDLYGKYIPEGGVFLDIGANVGINSIFAKRTVPSARVIAVEPSDENFALLTRNTRGLEIEVLNLALADHDGTVSFEGAGTGAHISERPGDSSKSVQARTLETLFREHAVDAVDLIKIDVEGFADLVLAGAGGVLPRCRRAIIEFSMHDALSRFAGDSTAARRSLTEIFRSCSEVFGHAYYISRENGLVRVGDGVELLDALAVEYNVGDVLFTNDNEEASISSSSLHVHKVRQLLAENHVRLTEIGQLRDRVASLERAQAPRDQMARWWARLVQPRQAGGRS